ncbi:MAG: 37S ribosomal protein S24, mitochondrial [Claussenomyces sp. TS43310]|nr:MAG: 37S ribosomal protein S24, mitochondrial [Claussenomyces sp. TS43310]
MATAMQGLRFTARRCSRRTLSHNHVPKSSGTSKQFSVSASRLAEGRDGTEIAGPSSTLDEQSPATTSPNAGVSKTRADGRSVSRSKKGASSSESQDFEGMLALTRAKIRNNPNSEFRMRRSGNGLQTRSRGLPQPGLLNMDDPRVLADAEFEMDDMTSVAHGELEQHREFREYARLAAWEMPLLTKMAKPFVPPTEKQVLRFRHTTYMGEEHPAEKKVVVEFCTADMPDLTPVQREKLKKLVGVRYNPATDIVKMSSEMFETQAQNKRYLGDLVATLLREARDPADDFADVPLDTRHHTVKVKPKFPVEWRMTDQRRAELEAVRQQAQLTDQQRALSGAIVDGMQQIQDSLTKKSIAAAAEPVPEMIMAGKGKGKGKKVAVRR